MASGSHILAMSNDAMPELGASGRIKIELRVPMKAKESIIGLVSLQEADYGSDTGSLYYVQDIVAVNGPPSFKQVDPVG